MLVMSSICNILERIIQMFFKIQIKYQVGKGGEADKKPFFFNFFIYFCCSFVAIIMPFRIVSPICQIPDLLL